MTTRRQFLLGGAATVATVALPAVTLAARPIEFIGIDWGFEPSQTAACLIQFVKEAEREIIRVTAIPYEDLYVRS